MPDDSRDDAESSPIAGGNRRYGAIGIGCVLVVTFLVGFVVWWYAFRSEPATWEAISRAQDRGDFEEAVELCIQLAEADRDQAAEALAFAGEMAIEPLSHFSRGEELILRALKHDPLNRRALSSYARVLTMTGQRWKASRWLASYVARFDDSLQQLIWLSDASVVITDWDLLTTARRVFPNDALPALGLAFDALVDRPEDAVRELQACLKANPRMIEANALLGRALLDSGQFEAFQKWDRTLPADCEMHPEVWRARGMWWKDRDVDKALRCYLECCRRAPDDAETNLQISLLLTQAGEVGAASVFRSRFEKINAYLDLVRAARERNDLSVALDAADLAEQLQRPVEALGWRRVAAQQGYSTQAPDHSSLESTVNSDSVVASKFDPDDVVDRSRWPIPGPVFFSGETVPVSRSDDGRFRFRNVAATVGLTSGVADQPNSPVVLESLHLVNGGGVAVFDYDSDGWPDLFLSQGAQALVAADTTPEDPLFRNIDGTLAQNTSEYALVADWNFAQGCSAGDFNGDGFSDIIVAGIGQNCLLQNLGDGTFRNVTGEAGMADDAWTSSCAFADLNSDSWPDVYEVRYIETEELFEKDCYATDRVRRPCPPKEFAAASDRIWMSAGDGTFAALPDNDVPVDAGRGLGLIIADFDKRPGLDIFIGNDGTEDFLLINQQEVADGTARFIDEATFRGVAVNGKGRMQASMGIAYGDVDRDGELDLFQANFHGQANTIYSGLGEGFFNDATARAGLYTPSLGMLGWGTELLDVDLDGWLDLVVINGHLEDRRRFGTPFRMPAQLFRNDGQGRFVEAVVENDDGSFQEPRLGRSLATLDWNRDGQMDLAVTSLDSPVALLIGDTESVGSFIQIHLIGVDSERDAIGATIVIEAFGFRQVYQLTAGDGFQASNQRRIHAGLGEARMIDRLTVSWPSSFVQEWEALNVDQEIIVVEGRESVVVVDGQGGIRQ